MDPEGHLGRIFSMAEPQLSVRSAKARDLARRLARREHRSIANIVERALEAYEMREAGREPAFAFYARLANDYAALSIWRPSFAKTGRPIWGRRLDLPRHQRDLGDDGTRRRCGAGIADGDNCRDRFRYWENSSRPEDRALGAGLGLPAPPFCRPDFPVHRSRRAR